MCHFFFNSYSGRGTVTNNVNQTRWVGGSGNINDLQTFPFDSEGIPSKCQQGGEVKKGQNIVNVVCECPFGICCMEWKLECRKSPSTKKFSPIILTVSRSIMMSETQDMQKKRVSNVQKRDARMIVAELLSTFQLCAKVNKTHQVYTNFFHKVEKI